jgi:hypothetical protein
MRLPLSPLLLAAGMLAALPPAALAQTGPPSARLFGTDDAPPPGMAPSRPQVVMRLAYLPPEGCPDEHLLRAAVGAQVRRWDPFAPNAPWQLSVALVQHGATYEGNAELRDVTGAVTWARALAPRARCSDLVEDLAVVLALHLNPPVPAARPAPLAPPTPPEPGPPAGPASPSPAAAPVRVAPRVGLAAWMDLATAPRPAFAVSADVGFRVAWFSLAGEIHWTPPAGATVKDGAEVSTSLVLGGLVPCAHAGWFAGCLVGELGRFQSTLATSKVTTPDAASTLYGLAGARLGAEIPVVPDRLFVRVMANLLGALGRPATRLGPQKGTPVVEWESPAFTAGLGVGLGAAF